MTGIKLMVPAALTGFVFTTAQPAIAQTTDAMDPLDPWQQFGLCGILAGLIAYGMRQHREAVKSISENLGDKIDAQTAAIQKGQGDQLDLLKKVVTEAGEKK